MQPIVSYGEANVTYFRVKVIQGCGVIPLPAKAYKFIPAVRKSIQKSHSSRNIICLQ
jgi:hypothetical protein